MQDVGLSELCVELEIAGIAPGDQQRLAAAVAAGAPLMTSKSRRLATLHPAVDPLSGDEGVGAFDWQASLTNFEQVEAEAQAEVEAEAGMEPEPEPEVRTPVDRRWVSEHTPSTPGEQTEADEDAAQLWEHRGAQVPSIYCRPRDQLQPKPPPKSPPGVNDSNGCANFEIGTGALIGGFDSPAGASTNAPPPSSSAAVSIAAAHEQMWQQSAAADGIASTRIEKEFFGGQADTADDDAVVTAETGPASISRFDEEAKVVKVVSAPGWPAAAVTDISQRFADGRGG